MHVICIKDEKAHSLNDINAANYPVDQKVIWCHIDGNMEMAKLWMKKHMSVDADTCAALCEELTRPRLFLNVNDEVVLTARALTFDRDKRQEMVSIRALVSKQFLLTLSLDDIPTVTTIADRLLLKSKGVTSPHHILEDLFEAISLEMTNHVVELDEQLSLIEDEWENTQISDSGCLHNLRSNTIRMRRYLLPQHEAYSRMNTVIEKQMDNEKEKFRHMANWREISNACRRDIEAINEMHERISILKDAIQHRTNEATNRIMYLLAIVSTFFLPLTFIASLFGMNVSGIPFNDKTWAFGLICLSMLILAFIQWMLFKHWKWLK